MGACGSKAVPPHAIDSKDVQIEEAGPVRFELIGQNINMREGGRAVRKTKDGKAFALVNGVLHSGTASASFKVDFKARPQMFYQFDLGVFPADLRLDSDVGSAERTRCALRLTLGHGGGWAQVYCDGEESGEVMGISWQPGDTVTVWRWRSSTRPPRASPSARPSSIRVHAPRSGRCGRTSSTR